VPSAPEATHPVANVRYREYTSPLQVQYFCSRCHAYPPAETLPRAAWREEVEQAYQFFAQSNLSLQPPGIDQVVRYFEMGAPLELPEADIERATTPLPVAFQRTAYVGPTEAAPTIANVNLAHLFDERRLDLVACDMRAGLVLALRPYAPTPAWEILGHVLNPAHAEVVDLDGDGVKDLLVADLGSAVPTDERTGSVVWLRGSLDGSFAPITLL